jgi:hypothetical protein
MWSRAPSASPQRARGWKTALLPRTHEYVRPGLYFGRPKRAPGRANEQRLLPEKGFVHFLPVLAQQGAQLILERRAPMMRFLIPDVRSHDFNL